MKNTLYLECTSGISGDMAVAALLDLGADQSILEHVLNSLPIDGFTIQVSRKKKAGLDVCDFDVILDQENHDHDMEYLHPKHSIKTEGMLQPCHHEHHTHTHGQPHAHSHMHRSLPDILSIIQKADMTCRAKQTATRIFSILGEAEAKAHGTTLNQVHFHEVGAVDSIVDLISVAVCLDNLNITDVIIPILQEGSGTIRCQHGILPVPVPATVNIIEKYQIPLQITNIQGEFVTPSGAAIAAAIRTHGQLPESFRILRTGLGGGKRTYEQPSILRAMLIEPCSSQDDAANTGHIYKLETNIDDCTGEMLGYTMECLLNAGARDVHYFPVYMKKNRPAYQLNVLCSQNDIPKLEQIIYRQTTTIGIRRQRMERSLLPREIKTIQTVYGEIQAKAYDADGCRRIYPEYESVVKICRQTGSAFPDIYRKLQEICCKQCP
ncbi:MAG: nickel pincer cofactor biosynthesis protein LarC [Eubacterium sp.]|nr:nickel pincer cofactor biosynthesis protein LarC [Eubacterium sp.]